MGQAGDRRVVVEQQAHQYGQARPEDEGEPDGQGDHPPQEEREPYLHGQLGLAQQLPDRLPSPLPAAPRHPLWPPVSIPRRDEQEDEVPGIEEKAGDEPAEERPRVLEDQDCAQEHQGQRRQRPPPLVPRLFPHQRAQPLLTVQLRGGIRQEGGDLVIEGERGRRLHAFRRRWPGIIKGFVSPSRPRAFPLPARCPSQPHRTFRPRSGDALPCAPARTRSSALVRRRATGWRPSPSA